MIAANALQEPCQAEPMTRLPSAGILLFRFTTGGVEVLLGHMGGPYWARKEAGAWTIPKGEYEPHETPEAAARREFSEELGVAVPDGELIPLGEVRQRGGKIVTAYALAGDLDPAIVVPGTFATEWPPGSGRQQGFPELDRVAWFPPADARDKIVSAQAAFLDRLLAALATAGGQ